MYSFTAHRLSASENVLFPDKIEINDNNIVYYKATVIGYQSSFIARNNVASVSVFLRIFFADIAIETWGGKRIVGRGFKKEDAREIVRLLT